MQSEVLTELICFSCRAAVTEFKISKCGHSKCQTCFELERVLGQCKCGANNNEKDQIKQGANVKNGQVTCPKCKILVSSDLWITHSDACFGIVKCVNSYKGCSMTGTFKNVFLEHICPFNNSDIEHSGNKNAIRSCKFRCGIIDMPCSDIIEHELICTENPNYVVGCEISECSFEGNHQDLRCHETEAINDHLKILLSKITNVERDLKRTQNTQQKIVKYLTKNPSKNCDESEKMIHKWAIEGFWKAMTALEPGARLQSDPFLYKRKDSEYNLRLVLYPCGTLTDHKNIYVLITNVGTPNDNSQKWPIPRHFLIRFDDGYLLDMGTVYKQSNYSNGVILGTMNDIACYIDGTGTLVLKIFASDFESKNAIG